MKIKQVLYRDIPRDKFRRGFSISFPPGVREIYFVLDSEYNELWDHLHSIREYIEGIQYVEALDNAKYFRIIYYPEKITEEDVINFAKSIRLEEE